MFACIYIPDFPVQAALLSEPAEKRTDLIRSPIAILDGPAHIPRVFAANSAARRAGIQIGMTKLQAEICDSIALRKRSLAAEESAQSVLLNCAATFSPRVESTAPGAVILDLTGTEKLFAKRKVDQFDGVRRTDACQAGRPREIWKSAAHAIAARTAEAGFHTRIAIAANPDTAFLAARGFSTNTMIPVGEEAQHLAPLPVVTLPLSPETLATLDSWGVRTFQSLAALPSVAIVERLGQEGLYIQKLTHGTIFRPLLTFEPEAEFAASFEFDDPVETLESIFFILNRLLQELCARLLSAAQAASELRLTIGLNVRQLAALCGREERESPRVVPRRSRAKTRLSPERSRRAAAAILSEPSGESKDLFEHVWKLPVPTQDKNLLFSLIHLHLQNVTFSAPVRFLRLEVVPVKPRLAQGNLFAPPSPEPEKLELTLKRIRGVVGATDAEGTGCAGSPHLLDTHKPGSFTLQRFSDLENSLSQAFPKAISQAHPERSRLIRKANQPAQSKDLYLTTNFAPAISLRLFRPALETIVELDGNKPHFVRLWNRQRRVRAASGPWSTSGNWWNAAAWIREEWDVALQTSTGIVMYRIYRDCLQSRWFVEGVFD